jgi:hypothetical protein
MVSAQGMSVQEGGVPPTFSPRARHPALTMPA